MTININKFKQKRSKQDKITNMKRNKNKRQGGCSSGGSKGKLAEAARK